MYQQDHANDRHRRALHSAIDASLADEPAGLTADELIRALPAFPSYLINDALVRLAVSGDVDMTGSPEVRRYRLADRGESGLINRRFDRDPNPEPTALESTG